ncbi:hypothetical protein V500_00209 [Pseudogymnoascus sp. VKM F-4518 (FW-2643)]|nr:hypothetical protein V500_00209 [Pseudogymnoascus sp. VKM F-4518 (FW-2643)]
MGAEHSDQKTLLQILPARRGSCEGDFDFTLLFEQSILSIGASALFLLVVPWQLWKLCVSETKTEPDSIFAVKLTAAAAFLGIEVRFGVVEDGNAGAD